jgi:hypothetical protein
VNNPPAKLGKAKVLFYTSIDKQHKPTGNTLHYVEGNIFGPTAGLAICQYDRDEGFYLFYCDVDWEVITDTFHLSLDDAMHQAEFEYEGVSKTWQQPEKG